MSGTDFVIPFGSLPEGFAESVEHPPAAPTTPRPAATVVLMRDVPGGPEVLLLRRRRSAGFVPGAYVFPGGRVDAADAEPELLARVDGLSAAEAAERLGAVAEGPPAIAYYLAAVREAFEETGILVGTREGGGAPPSAAAEAGTDEIRNALMADALSFAEALGRLGCRIRLDAVVYVAHWITPEPEPRRYDTRFFLAKVPAAARALIDSREMTDARWLHPSRALDLRSAGTLPMVFPTIKTLEALGRYADADEALAELGARSVPTILPRLVVTPTGIGMELERGG